jgi:thiol-disulfide isomerase/thioredoxin
MLTHNGGGGGGVAAAAAEWCKHCQVLAPIWEKVAAELDGKVSYNSVHAITAQGLLCRQCIHRRSCSFAAWWRWL